MGKTGYVYSEPDLGSAFSSKAKDIYGKINGREFKIYNDGDEPEATVDGDSVHPEDAKLLLAKYGHLAIDAENEDRKIEIANQELKQNKVKEALADLL